MEQGERNSVLGKQRRQLFLGPVLGPGGTEKTGVLGGIGIADHDFLARGDSLPVERQRQQGRHGLLGTVQVIQGLKERHHAHGLADTGDLLQQHHRHHIGRCGRHGNHVGPQPFTALLGDHLTGGQHFGYLGGAVFAIAERGINQRPARLQFVYQKRLAGRFIPVVVTAQLQIAGDRIQHLTVAGGFLADIQPQQGNPEAVQAAQGVLQITIGDIAQTHRT